MKTEKEVSGPQVDSAPTALGPVIDLDALCVSQDFDEVVEGEEQSSAVHVGKPKPSWFVRVMPTWSICMRLYRSDAERGRFYFLSPDLPSDVLELGVRYTIVFGVNLDDDYFFWPLKLPPPSGQLDKWSKTAREAADLSKEAWVRVSPDQLRGCYRRFRALGTHDEPVWPSDAEIRALLLQAVGENYVDSTSHPLVARLEGR